MKPDGRKPRIVWQMTIRLTGVMPIGGRTYEIPDREWAVGEENLRRALVHPRAALPGDADELRVPLRLRRSVGTICIVGAESCPPEDCGGPDGYRAILAVLRDPLHLEHDETRVWASQRYLADFDPQVATLTMLRFLARCASERSPGDS
jgi:hypothetical protein